MTTITGKIENAAGEPLHALIDFVSRSTPLVGSGIVTTNTDLSLRSNPSDGTFSVQLAAGNYQVTITAQEQTSTFNIAVPPGSSTVSIETIVTTPLAYTFVPPASTWNGQWAGNITFVPIANPAAPTTAPVTYAGGHQTGTDAFAYRIAWNSANGESLASPEVTNTAPTSPHNATRITFPTVPSGVTGIVIYRSTNDSTLNRYLLTILDPTSAYYDDWESTADFNARLAPSQTAPTINNTAGQFFSSHESSSGALAITDQGVALQSIVFMQGTNARWKPGKGIQFYNPTTGLWHTKLCTGNPPQDAWDAGES